MLRSPRTAPVKIAEERALKGKTKAEALRNREQEKVAEDLNRRLAEREDLQIPEIANLKKAAEEGTALKVPSNDVVQKSNFGLQFGTIFPKKSLVCTPE